MTNEQIAIVCHEANRAYCKSVGDDSQLSWDLAPQWQRDSAVSGVEFLRSHPGAGPHSSHENWLSVKLANGWKYGPVKDEDKKEHPCLVPYEQLPKAQKLKDHLFNAVFRALEVE